MSDPETPAAPVVVKASSTSAEIETTIGQLIPAAGGVLLAYGAITAEKWAAISAVLPLLLSLFWRLWRTRRNHAKMVTMAKAAPDEIAQIRK